MIRKGMRVLVVWSGGYLRDESSREGVACWENANGTWSVYMDEKPRTTSTRFVAASVSRHQYLPMLRPVSAVDLLSRVLDG